MAIQSYANAQLSTNNTISDWLNITNSMIQDMATIVLTVSNSGFTTAEGSIEVTEGFGANTGFFSGGIRGGDANVSGTLTVLSDITSTSNAEFNAITATGDITGDNLIGSGYIEANSAHFDGGISGGTNSATGILDVLDGLNVTGNSAVEILVSEDISVSNTFAVTGDSTFNGDVSFSNSSVITISSLIESTNFLNKIITVTGNSSPISLDITAGSLYEIVLSEDTDITFDASGLATADNDQAYSFAVKVTQDSGGNQYVLNLSNNSISWSYGLAPVLSTTANKSDYLVFESTDQGNTFVGFISGQDI